MHEYFFACDNSILSKKLLLFSSPSLPKIVFAGELEGCERRNSEWNGYMLLEKRCSCENILKLIYWTL